MKTRVGTHVPFLVPFFVPFLVLLMALLWGCRTLDYRLVATEGVRSLADPGRNTAVAEVAGVSYLVEVGPGDRGSVVRLAVVNRTSRVVRLDPKTTVEASDQGDLWTLVETRPLPSPHPAPDDAENLRREYNKLALEKGILPDAEFQRREDDLKARMERLDAGTPRGADSSEAPPGGRAEMVLTFADAGAPYLRLVTVAEGSTPLVFVFRRAHP